MLFLCLQSRQLVLVTRRRVRTRYGDDALESNAHRGYKQGQIAMQFPKNSKGLINPELRRRGIFLLPNALTTAALFAGFYAIVGIVLYSIRDKFIKVPLVNSFIKNLYYEN